MTSKKIAIMQPYFFPYLGYFQLIASVEKFVLLDDVNYITRGWINRNRIMVNGTVHTFTIPLKKASQNKLVCDIELSDSIEWQSKLMRTIQMAYARAPYYSTTLQLLKEIIFFQTAKLDVYLRHSINLLTEYLSIETHVVESSRIYQNSKLRGQDRIVDICVQEGASAYLNPIGGKALYNSEIFQSRGISLQFIEPRSFPNSGNTPERPKSLSIIDVLMFNEKTVVSNFLKVARHI